MGIFLYLKWHKIYNMPFIYAAVILILWNEPRQHELRFPRLV